VDVRGGHPSRRAAVLPRGQAVSQRSPANSCAAQTGSPAATRPLLPRRRGGRSRAAFTRVKSGGRRPVQIRIDLKNGTGDQLSGGELNRRDAKSAEKRCWGRFPALHCYSQSCSPVARNPCATPKDRIMARQNHK